MLLRHILAAGLALSAVSAVMGDIVYRPLDIVVVEDGDRNWSQDIFIDIDGDSEDDLFLSASNAFFMTGLFRMHSVTVTTLNSRVLRGLTPNTPPQPLVAGYAIGFSGSPFIFSEAIRGTLVQSASFFQGFETPPTPRYLGIELLSDNGPHYAWLTVEVDRAPVNHRLIIAAAAYDSETGVPIISGAIPGPSVLALLGIGGVAAMRRRR